MQALARDGNSHDAIQEAETLTSCEAQVRAFLQCGFLDQNRASVASAVNRFELRVAS